MTCPACTYLEACERAAIEDRDPPPPCGAPCTCPDADLDVLHVSPEAFARVPQVGAPLRMTWEALAVRLMRPETGARKDCAGAWSPARYRGNVRRKAAIEAVHALVLDIDEAGDVDRVAGLLGGWRAVVHETFTSTAAAPRCRAVLFFAAPVSAADCEAVGAVVRAHLERHGLTFDPSAKDASRLCYWPVRRSGDGYRVRVLDGAPLDVAAVLAAQPPPRHRVVAPPVVSVVSSAGTATHSGAYVTAALRRAADAVGRAPAGDRHGELCRQAYSLARLDLPEHEIESALLPAFVAAAGPTRETEGRRTIRDALQARRAL